MNGAGRAFSAVSVINAIPCGIGAVIGTELEIRAEIALGGDELRVEMMGQQADSGLARICVSRSLESLGEEQRGGTLRIQSEIPVSRGLKSSSAAANAIVSAVCDALDVNPGREWILNMGVDCALEAGVTVTGAFDDACGSLCGGFVMTDNAERSLLLVEDLEPMDVILHIPPSRSDRAEESMGRLRARGEDMLAIVRMARQDPLRALSENGRLVAECMGLDNRVAEMALSAGALAAGISGTGPATAILLPMGEGEEFMSRLEVDDLLLTKTRRLVDGHLL